MADDHRTSGDGAAAESPLTTWFVLRNGEREGPMSLDELKERSRASTIDPDDLIWCPALPQWIAAREILPAPLAPELGPPRLDASPGSISPRMELGEEKPSADVTGQHRRAAIAYALLVAVMIALSLTSCFQFLAEGDARIETFSARGVDPKNALTLKAQIVETNLVREQMRLYVTPSVGGALAAQGASRLPARDIELTLATVNGPRVVMLKRDHHLEPFDIDIALSDGHILLYPMDRYKGWLEAEALILNGTAAPEKVPVAIEFNPRNHAVHVAPSLDSRTEASDVVVQLHVSRLVPVVVFTWFMAGVAAIISLTVVLVVISVISGRRQPDLGMLGWSTALLFALPAVRNNLPGAPPLGALIDYSAFFWAESLVGLSMLVLVALWFRARGEAT